MYEEDNAQWGLVHGFVLDGKGGACAVARAQLDELQLAQGQSLWLHWDRSHPQTQNWLRRDSGLSEFACDLLLEENTRPRALPLPNDELLVFLRGVNLNPGAEPEDMVSVRIFAEERRIISLRLRPLRATEDLIERLQVGKGPKTASELVLQLSDYLTDKVEDLVAELSELVDGQEEKVDGDERALPDHGLLLQIRRRAANLRRFLSPQRDIYVQLTRSQLPWLTHEDGIYWNELNNRLLRYLEELELTRERIGLLLETENRRMDVRMNHIMFRFGIITCVFLPMSFVTGLLGINVGGIPGADSPYGFLVACLLMLSIGFGQWLLFRRLRWV
ncbi:zinc transporter [Pseudomonas sp. BIGb0408]|uniref:Zinc transporter n=1 Tax=Phytopseudomonas flavescens TaxID=29435 RepID=A0A7Y9XJT9_9GAMM|nr:MULTISPECIES: zinc transporter ZntB [Pseudomonas]MCW2292878.1 zinc transporter [Pseudomonas sp. BIGb0408]NYH72552.1 zinc transporter [Pseudomonas flavescens]